MISTRKGNPAPTRTRSYTEKNARSEIGGLGNAQLLHHGILHIAMRRATAGIAASWFVDKNIIDTGTSQLKLTKGHVVYL